MERKKKGKGKEKEKERKREGKGKRKRKRKKKRKKKKKKNKKEIENMMQTDLQLQCNEDAVQCKPNQPIRKRPLIESQQADWLLHYGG